MNKSRLEENNSQESCSFQSSLPIKFLSQLARLAAQCFDMPYALICLFQSNQRTVLARHGPQWLEKMPDMLFSISRTLGRPELLISDIRLDPWCAHSPAVRGSQGICFYAGATIFLDQDAVGVFCVLDHEPHNEVGEREMKWLRGLAEMVAQTFEVEGDLPAAEEPPAVEEERNPSWRLPFFNLPLIDLDDKTPPELRAMEIFQQVMDTSPQAVYWKDRSSTYLWCNRYFAEDTGIGSPEGIYGKTDDDLTFTPEQAEQIRCVDQQVINEGLPVLRRVEVRNLAGGRQAWLEINKVPVFDIEGNLIGILGTYQDVTERKIAEEEVQSSKQVLQIIFDNIPQRVFWKDCNSVLIGGNRAFARDAGFDNPEDLIGKTDHDLPWRAEAEAFIQDDRTVVETDTPKYHIIEPMTQAENLAWLDTNKVPLHDANGNVAGILGTYEVITERKEAEEALKRAYDDLEIRIQQRTKELYEANELLKNEILVRQRTEAELLVSRERYALAVSAGQVGVWEWDVASQELYIDPSLVTVLNLDVKSGENVGQAAESAIYPEDRVPVIQEWRSFLAGKYPLYEKEYRVSQPGGGFRWVLARGSTISNDQGEPVRMVGSMTDITDLKAVENALRRRDQILDALTYASQELLSSKDLDLNLPNVLKQLGAAIGFERAYILKNLDEDYAAQGARLFACWLSASDAVPLPEWITYAEWDIAAWMQPLGMGMPVCGLRESFPVQERTFFDRLRTGSLVWMPIFSDRTWWGVLGFDSRDPARQCIPAEIEALKTAASTLGAAFAQQRIQTAEREQRNLAEALSDIAALLNSTLNLDGVLERILSEIGRVVPHDSATITLVEEKTNRPTHLEGLEGQGLLAGSETPTQRGVLPSQNIMIQTHQPMVIIDTENSPVWVSRPHLDWVRSYLGAPIQLEGEVIGFIHLNSATPGFFKPIHARRLEAFTDQAAIAIQNARLYEQAQALAALEERQRIARDLHDAVSQTLWTASIMAEVLPVLWENDPEDGQRYLDRLRRLTQGALAEMRMLLLELRPTALLESCLNDLLQQLAQATMSRKKLNITVEAPEPVSLHPEVQVGIYRIAQETLNNIVKHSRASEVHMKLDAIPDGVRLAIRDNGLGFDMDKISLERLGLHIMRERAAAIAAALTIDSAVGHGTRVTVIWINPQKIERQEETA